MLKATELNFITLLVALMRIFLQGLLHRAEMILSVAAAVVKAPILALEFMRPPPFSVQRGICLRSPLRVVAQIMTVGISSTVVYRIKL